MPAKSESRPRTIVFRLTQSEYDRIQARLSETTVRLGLGQGDRVPAWVIAAAIEVELKGDSDAGAE